MSIVGSHLEKLYHLRNRINDEIRIAERQAGIRAAQTKAKAPKKPRAASKLPTAEQRAAAAGVTTQQVRTWAYTRGLLEPGRPGRLSHAVLDQYLAAAAGVTTQQVRTWAYTRGLLEPGRPGRLSHAVLDQYLAAHQNQQEAS